MLALSCVLLPSCSNDDGDTPDNGGQANVKRLVSMKCSDGLESITNINYDDKNRIVSYTANCYSDKLDEYYSQIYSFDYDDNGSIIPIKIDGEIESILRFDNGVINIIDYGESECTVLKYDQKRLNSVSFQWLGEESSKYYYTWFNNNILKIEPDDAAAINYEYTSDVCITPIIYYFVLEGTPYSPLRGDDIIALYSYGYFGDVLTSNLVKKSSSSYDHTGYEFSYELDNDGYVIKMTISDEYDHTRTFEYIWRN